MLGLLVAPVALQGAAMLVDELVFHRARGLPKWERIGHPLDTLTVVGTYAWALVHAPTHGAIVGYAFLAVFSCLFVTKDEPVHSRLCNAGEMWLHAIQFVLHPIVFVAFAILWVRGGHATLLQVWAGATAAFGLYQIVYWSLIWRPRR
jgi:hypothetical protein